VGAGLVFERGEFKMSAVLRVSGRLEMAGVRGGRSEIAAICEGGGEN